MSDGTHFPPGPAFPFAQATANAVRAAHKPVSDAFYDAIREGLALGGHQFAGSLALLAFTALQVAYGDDFEVVLDEFVFSTDLADILGDEDDAD
jgi:hypothetical protein